jgi:hypothetical protein
MNKVANKGFKKIEKKKVILVENEVQKTFSINEKKNLKENPTKTKMNNEKINETDLLPPSTIQKIKTLNFY